MFNTGKKNKVKGLAVWQSKVNKVPENALKDIAVRTESRGKGLAWQARQYVPVESGDLKRSISARIENTNKSTYTYITAGLSYAKDVEFGTSKQAAKPYMLPAFDKYAAKYVEEDLRIAIKKAVRKK